MHQLSISLSSLITAALMLAQYTPHSHANCQTGTRTIQFSSKITKDKKGYKLWVTTYRPSIFKVTINGQELRDGKTITVPVENNSFRIRYDYKFSAIVTSFAGYREVEFELDPTRDQYNIDFSWKHNDRFIIEHARFKKITLLYEPGSEHAQ